MNIGFFSEALPYLPTRGGFRIYGGNLIRCLSQRHRIDLVSLLVEDDEKHLDWARKYCSSLTTIPAGRASVPLRYISFVSSFFWGKPLHLRAQMAAILREGVRSKRWDVIHIEGPYMGGLVPAELPIAKVLSVHDSWTLRCEEMLKCSQNLRQKLYFTLLKCREPRWERLVYPRFDRCILVADRDAMAVQKTVPGAKVAVIPYGVDTDYFSPVPGEKEKATIVFHGHMGYGPNIVAALDFANRILPLILREMPNTIFRIVAANPAPEILALASRTEIQLTVNPADVRPLLSSAQVYVCAIRHGTGMKNKILEALAMHLPIVCYFPSIEGIDCEPGKHLLVARDPQDFASCVINLLRNPQRANQIAQAGRRLVTEKYNWDSCTRAFEESYQQVIEEYRMKVQKRK